MTPPNSTPTSKVLRTVMEEHDLTVTQLAKELGIGRPACSNLINGKYGLSIETAVRLEQRFGHSASAVLHGQLAHELAHYLRTLVLLAAVLLCAADCLSLTPFHVCGWLWPHSH